MGDSYQGKEWDRLNILQNGSHLKIENSISKSSSTVSSTTIFDICYCILKSLSIPLCPTVGNQTVMDIVVMMGCFIMDLERESHLVQQTQPVIQSTVPVIQLVVVSTTLHKNSFSRKMIIHFRLAFRVGLLFIHILIVCLEDWDKD